MSYLSVSEMLAGKGSSKHERTAKSIVVFDDDEHRVLTDVLNCLHSYTFPGELENIAQQFSILHQLAYAISCYPSIQTDSELAGEKRSVQTLVVKLCGTASDSRLLNLPAKVVVGRSFLVAKFQTLSGLVKIAMNSYLEESLIQSLKKITMHVMFTLMAEDLYTDLLNNEILEYEIREEIAQALIELWDKRLDKRSSLFAPILHRVWITRTKIAPNFGTMLGVSEFFLFGLDVDDSWTRFMIKNLEKPDIAHALEEFLFGISYEKISMLHTYVQKQGCRSINRDQVYELVGCADDFQTDNLQLFYQSFTQRRKKAAFRKQLRTFSTDNQVSKLLTGEYYFDLPKLEGPIRTIEDYYIQFMFEQNHIKKDITD